MKFQLVSLFIDSLDNVIWFLMVCTPKTSSFLNVAIEEFLSKITSFLRGEMPHSSNLRQSLIMCSVFSWSFPLFRRGISIMKVVNYIGEAICFVTSPVRKLYTCLIRWYCLMQRTFQSILNPLTHLVDFFKVLAGVVHLIYNWVSLCDTSFDLRSQSHHSICKRVWALWLQ